MKIIILAGGGGTRLFPLSRNEYPKQFLKVFQDISLLVQTLKRFEAITNPQDIVIVTGKKYELHVKNELSSCNLDKVNILIEPEAKNTGPAIALAVNYCKNKLNCAADETIFVATSDHLISPADSFTNNVLQGIKIANSGKIVVFGVKPDKPETGFGYIKIGEPYNDGYLVEEFREKPDLETAEKYLEEKKYFWNSGMFCFKVNVFYNELHKYSSEIFSLCEKKYSELLASFARMPNISIDFALIERTKNIAMIPLSCIWKDIGSWDAIYEHMDKDENKNVINGDVIAIDCKNSLFMGKKRLIAGLGLSDMLIVETDDVILVAKRGESQLVKTLVERLQEDKRPEADNTNTVHRPWGYFTIHDECDSYKIKTIVVNPGASLSLQMHYHRSEHWVVTKGTATVEIDGVEQIISKSQSVFVPLGVKHRIHNAGIVNLEIVEVQNGDYLGEDDIVRFEDEYGRRT